MKTKRFTLNRRIVVVCVAVTAMLFAGISLLTLTASARNEKYPDPKTANASHSAVNPGRAYVAMSDSNEVAMIDTATHAYLGSIYLFDHNCSFPWRATMSPDAAHVYVSCDHSSSVVVIDTTSNTVVTTIVDLPYADDITFVQDGSYALVGSRNTSQIKVIDTATLSVIDTIVTPGITRSLVAHPSTDLAYVTSQNGHILVVDTITFTILTSIAVGGDPWDVAVSPNGQWVFAGDRWGAGLHVIDANTNTLFTTITDTGELTGLSITPNGQKLFAGGLFSGVRVFDVPTLSHETNVSITGPVWATAVTCDGSELYIGNRSTSVPVLNTTTYSTITNVSVSGFGSRGIAICPEFVSNFITLAPPTQTNAGAIGETVAHQLRLYNGADITDTYTIALGSHVWDSTPTTLQVGPLQPGELVTFTVNVTVPVSADWYDTDSVVLTATSVTSPSVYSDTAVITTLAYAPPQISASPTQISSTQSVGEIVTDTLTLSNANGITYTFVIRQEETTPNEVVSYARAASVMAPQPWKPEQSTDEPNVITAVENATSFSPVIITDPLGDASSIDVVEVAATASNTDMTMRLTFAPELGPIGAYGYVHLDTDQDANTGVSPEIYGGNASQDIGVDYYLFLFNLPDTVDIYSVDSGYLSSVIPAFTNDSFEFTIPLAALGNDDGNMDVTVVVGDSLWATDWAPDAGHGTVHSSQGVSWLTVNPVTGTLATNSSLPVQIVRNASELQPGLYTANMAVISNEPANSVATIPVSMTVQPTANMGWVEGTITDDGTGLPLEATLIAQGQPYTITANPTTGYYIFWLDAGTYTLQISAEGYVSETQSINIVAQQGITQDFDLVLNVPVVHITHDGLEVAQNVGEITTRALTITNAGPALLEFDIHQVATGYTPLSYVRNQLNPTLPETAVSTSPAPGPLANTPTAVHLDGNPVLIIQDSHPWGHDSIQQILNNNSIAYDQVDSSYMATVYLSAYELVIIPSVQGSSFYHEWNVNLTRFEAYVQAGGALWLSGTTSGENPAVPGGVMNHYWQDNFNHVLLPSHPWVATVPGQIRGNNASHNYFTNLYPNSDVVAQATGNSGATLIDYQMGGGRILLTGQNLELAWAYGWDFAPILENSLLDMFAWEPGDISWLTVEPISGTVAGYSSQPVTVTFDATGLQPGTYTAQKQIANNDPVNEFLTLPITMTVTPSSGMGQVTGTVTDLWTGNPLTATVQLMGVYTDTAVPDYSIWANAGSYTLVASASGYMTSTYNIAIPANGVVVQDIALEPAQPLLDDMPTELEITAVPGHLIPYTFTLANTGPLPLDYAWHEMDPTQFNLAIPTDLNGKVFLYDQAHGQYDWSTFSILRNDIISAGGVITQNFVLPFTANTLEGIDVLWVNCCGNVNWTYAELQVIDAWMQEGGSILVHGYDSPATADIAGIFNIVYDCCIINMGPTTNILSHPTTIGVNEIEHGYGMGTLTYTQSADAIVLDSNGFPIAVAQQQEGGKMVVISKDFFEDYRMIQSDNHLFAMNVFNWLAAPGYGDVPWVSVSPVSGAITGHSSQDMLVMLDTTSLTLGTHEATLALEHNDPAHASPILLPVTVQVVEQTAVVTLTPTTTSGSGLPRSAVTYTLTVQNGGNGPDTFDISVSGDWTATPSITTTDELMPGQSQQFTVVVQIPADANPNSAMATAVTATSQFNNASTQTVTVTTTAISLFDIYLPILLKP